MTAAQGTLCPGCFAASATAVPCRVCGYDPAVPHPPTALAPGSLLNGQFIIGRVLGRPGGFGITYLGFDRRLRARVAIKEYLPRDLAARAPDGASILPHGTEEAAVFRFGLGQFEQEAQTLARLDHPNIVRVRQFLEANGSACLVMDYYQGVTLAEYLERQPDGRLPEDTGVALLQPMLDGLRAVHAEGLLHRDIKPANLYLAQTRSGGARPILLDFGAARQAVGERSRSLSVVLTEGYAPFEQYSRKGHQGPWTDVYAAAAVLYRCVTGATPPAANDRMLDDDLTPATAFGVSAGLSAALAAGLALRPEERPQTVDAWRALLAKPPQPVPQPPVVVGRPSAPSPGPWTPGSAPETPVATPPLVPDIHCWPTERVQRLQRDAAATLGLPVSFRDADFSPRVRQRVKTGERSRWLGDPEPVFEEREALVATRPPEMVVIPAGSFLMGSPDNERDRKDAEGPQHRVTIARPFAIGRHAVTFDDYDVFCAATGREQPADAGWGRGQRPVINVAWNDAVAYCEWLSQQTGRAYRLPSEAEWEYASRAGTATPFHFGATMTTDQANFDGRYPYGGASKGQCRQRTVPVGSLPPNPWGLHEVHGNVWEWCADRWHEDYHRAPDDGSAWADAGKGSARVVRGGSWHDSARDCRSAIRAGGHPDYRYGSAGFRCARTLEP